MIPWCFKACSRQAAKISPKLSFIYLLVGLVVKASVSKAAEPGSTPSFPVENSPGRVIPVTWNLVRHWLPSHAPGVIQGQCWDWSARCQYTVTGWDGKFGLQLLSQCGGTWNWADPSLRYAIACSWDVHSQQITTIRLLPSSPVVVVLIPLDHFHGLSVEPYASSAYGRRSSLSRLVFKNWQSSGSPARHQVSWGQC